MAIGTMYELREALSAGQIVPFYKQWLSMSSGNGVYHDRFFVNPDAASRPPATGVGEAVTSATAGALRFRNPGAGNKLYLGRAVFNSGSTGFFFLYDRLVQTSGLVGNTTDAQTVNSTALTRHTTGAGCQLWVSVHASTGSGNPTIDVSYTNQAGTAGRAGVGSITAFPNINRLYFVRLQSGDTGVRSVESVTMSVATSEAGDFGITITKPITTFSIQAQGRQNDTHARIYDAIALGFPEIAADACLAFAGVCTGDSTTLEAISGQLTLVEG